MISNRSDFCKLSVIQYALLRYEIRTPMALQSWVSVFSSGIWTTFMTSWFPLFDGFSIAQWFTNNPIFPVICFKAKCHILPHVLVWSFLLYLLISSFINHLAILCIPACILSSRTMNCSAPSPSTPIVSFQPRWRTHVEFASQFHFKNGPILTIRHMPVSSNCCCLQRSFFPAPSIIFFDLWKFKIFMRKHPLHGHQSQRSSSSPSLTVSCKSLEQN